MALFKILKGSGNLPTTKTEGWAYVKKINNEAAEFYVDYDANTRLQVGKQYNVVSATEDGIVPKFDAADGRIDSNSSDWVLTNNNGSLGWYRLPTNAFKNDNTNTTYTLSGAASGDTWVTTLTGSDNATTTSTVPAASTTAAGLMTSAMVAKLNGIAEGATANKGDITQVTAGDGLTGGATSGNATLSANLGAGLVFDANKKIAANTSYTSANKNYAVKTDSSGALYVNVPWSDTDTHHVTRIYTGASGATAHATSPVSNPYITVTDNNVYRTQVQLKGDGATSISADDGVITISSTNTTYSAFKGASASENGGTGLVPAPLKGQEGYYLRGDGVWFNLTGMDESVQNTFGALQKAWKEADSSLKDTLTTLINGKAQTNHASSGTSYGISTTSLYGHAMASSTTPKASAATAAVGSETAKFARGDHVHPLTVSNSWTAGTTAGPKVATTVNNVTGTAIAIPTATASASGAVIVGDQTFGGIKRFSATDVSYTHELGTYYNYNNGYLIELGTASSWTMVTIHISGNSYGPSDLPIDSWFQFYDYNTADGILSPSGVNNGYPLGAMTVYRYNSKLYAWIAQGRNYQTLAFTIYTNAKHLTPVVTNAAKHTTNTSFVTTITPYLSLNTLNYNSYAPKLDGTGAVGTWGISISGNAATANALTVNAGDAGQPVYFTGGIPAAIDWHIGNQNVGEHNCNNVTYNFAGYYTSNGPATSLGPTTNDGALWAQAYSSSWVAQMAQDYRDGSLYVRGRNSGTWTAWQNVILGNGYQNVGPIKLTTGAGANNITTNYISAGRGYSTGSGLNGLKLVATEQDDAISGIGQDCTGKAYELSIAAAQGTSGQGYITFVGHKMASLNTYNELGHFNFANSTFYVNGKIGVGTTSPSYAIHAIGDIYANGGWLRSSGNTGWYNQTYDGGWHMTDGTFVRSYSSKAVLIGNSIFVGTSAGNGTGLSLYSTSEPTVYGIHMSTTSNYGKFGDVQSDWATYFNMNAVGQRGWIYRAGSTNVASISANGIGAFKGITTANRSNSEGTYYTSGLEIREYNYAGAGTDSWGQAPRLSFHWSGKVAAQIGLASNGYLYTAPSTGTTFYKLVYESGTWGIDISGNAATASALKGVSSSSAVPLTDPGAGMVKYYYNVNNGLTGNMPTTNNANGILYLNTHSGEYGYQLGFSSNGHIYYRHKNGSAFTTSTAWNTILDSGNYTDYTDSRYVNVSGDTMTGKLQVNAPIFGYNYTNSNNAAAFIFDKPSSNYTGIGACSESDTIYFGACDANGSWVTSYRQKWKFNGSLVVGGGDDNCNIVPWTNNYSTIGTESLKWWKIYATNIYGDKVYGAVWNDYAEYRSQFENISAGRVAYCKNDGKLRITTERLQRFEGVVSDTFGFAIGETDNAKTPLAVSGRVLVYTYEPKDTFNSGDCVCAAPNGTVSKMTREEIVTYPDRIVGIVSEIPDYETWGTGEVPVDGRIWIKVK